MDCGEIQRLWVKGLGYVSDKHVYKFKDYSEAVFDTQIISKKWLCKELKKVVPETNHISILAGWYGLVSIPFLYQIFGLFPGINQAQPLTHKQQSVSYTHLTLPTNREV